jgi:hypothetical protein
VGQGENEQVERGNLRRPAERPEHTFYQTDVAPATVESMNESALAVQLTLEDLSELEAEFSKLKVHGGRTNEMQMQIVERAG